MNRRSAARGRPPSAGAVLAVAVLGFCALHVDCGGKLKSSLPPLHITSTAPSGDVLDSFAAIRIGFDRPAVSEATVGRFLDEVPVEIEPELKVKAHWVDRQTLMMRPAVAMRPSTRYKVTLSGKLRARIKSGESAGFSFVHDPLAVKGITGIDTDWVSPHPTFALQLNQAVEAGQVTKRCSLAAENGTHQAGLDTPNTGLASTSIALSAAEPLRAGVSYRFECQDLVAKDGNEPLAEPFKTVLKAYPPLSVVTFEPAGGEVAPDELKVKIAFTTPVSPDQLQRNISIRPPAETFPREWMRANRTSYEVELNLQASTDYTIKLNAGLVDEFGQKMEKSREFGFRTTDASPGLSVETGIYAIETSSDGYQVWARNVSHIEVGCASVPKRRVAAVLAASLDFYPWYSATPEPLKWEQLGLKRRTTILSIPEVKNKWQLQKLNLSQLCASPTSRGLYLAELRSPEVEKVRAERGGLYPYRILGNVTDLGVLLKVGPASGLVWVAGISDGKPVPGASVTLYDSKAKRIFSGTTDADGLLRLPGSTSLLAQTKAEDRDPFEQDSYEDFYGRQRMIATVEKSGDLAVVDGYWNDGIQAWNFGAQTDWRRGETRIRGFIQSDRGIYRPGDTAHFKGLAREVALGSVPRVPQGAEAAVRVEDARGSSIFEKRLPLSEFGGFSFDVPLGAGVPVGDYYAQVKIKGQVFREQFSVEEFRPVSFEILEEKPVRESRLGQKLEFAFAANYLFGAPVKKAKVNWNLQRRERYLYFEEFSDYSFSDNSGNDSWYPWYEGFGYEYAFVSDGETQTGDDGRFRIAVKDPTSGLVNPQDYILQTNVKDAADQTVTKSVVLSAHRTAFYLGIRPEEWVQPVDTAFFVKMIAVDTAGKRIPAKAKLSLIRQSWECKTTGNYRVYSTCERKDHLILTRDVDIPAKGEGTERISADAPGDYAIRVESRDAYGEKVAASNSVWITGKGNAFYGGNETAKMLLVPNKDRYQPGETARLAPQADTAGASLLVTLERNGIIQALVVPPERAEQAIEVPITQERAPNVYVSVAAIKGRTGPGDANRPRFRLGIANLKVAFDNRRLEVRINTEKAEYRPGEQVRGKLAVTSGGVPVRAEVSLSVADEGVLQLIAYQTPDPMNAFYAPWGLGIENAANWSRIARAKDPASMEAQEGMDGGKGRGSEVRSRFVASAYWAPALVTDQAGEASFSFAAPDNLTAFRLMAVAADVADKFGSGEARIRIRKDLMATPVLPRFFTAGDRTDIGAVVHNYSGKNGEVLVIAQVTGLTIENGQRKVRIKNGESAQVLFSAKVGSRNQATVKLTATIGDARDAMQQTVPVTLPIVTDRTTLGEGKLQESASYEFSRPDGIRIEESRLELVVDRAGLAGLENSLRYLIHYPYGCLEQTLSGLIPLFKVKDLAAVLNLKELQGLRLQTYIQLGIAKVLRHQQEDGHFSLWPDSRTYPHLTAYALYGLLEGKRSGLRVNAKAIERGMQALRDWANDQERKLGPGGESATVAMAAYVLAAGGKPDPGLAARLFEARRALPVYGKAFLLRALAPAKAPAEQIQSLVSEIAAAAVFKGDAALIHETQTNLDDYMSSDNRSSAMVLSALLDIDRNHPLIEPLATGIKQARGAEGRWYNTQENIYSLIALADYAKQNAQGTARVRIELNGEKLDEHLLQGGEIFSSSHPLKSLKPGRLTIIADQPVFYAARLLLVRDIKEDDSVAAGFSITRQYLDFETEKPLDSIKIGQLVKVRLRVETPKARGYVALVDPIPAGCEALHTGFATEAAPSSGQGRSSWAWDYREIRDDRVETFAEHMDQGRHEFEYLLRSAFTGDFNAAPAHAEAMYQPTNYGRTATTHIKIIR